MLRLLEDPRLVPLIVALGWAGFYGSVAASNVTDLLGLLGLPMPYRSGNVVWVQSSLGLLGKPLALAAVVVVLATLLQALSAALYLRAAARLWRQRAGSVAALRAATAPGLALWFFFVVGVEVLLAFEKVDWTKFVALIVGTLVSLAVSELILRGAPDRPGSVARD